jgi:hypothetical protein
MMTRNAQEDLSEGDASLRRTTAQDSDVFQRQAEARLQLAIIEADEQLADALLARVVMGPNESTNETGVCHVADLTHLNSPIGIGLTAYSVTLANLNRIRIVGMSRADDLVSFVSSRLRQSG